MQDDHMTWATFRSDQGAAAVRDWWASESDEGRAIVAEAVVRLQDHHEPAMRIVARLAGQKMFELVTELGLGEDEK